MNIGMLWFDNDSKSALDARIARAATYYQTKYGKKPTLCYVHPSMLPPREPAVAVSDPGLAGDPPAAAVAPGETGLKSGGVEVRATRSVLPNHFWIGINGQGSASPAGS